MTSSGSAHLGAGPDRAITPIFSAYPAAHASPARSADARSVKTGSVPARRGRDGPAQVPAESFHSRDQTWPGFRLLKHSPRASRPARSGTMLRSTQSALDDATGTGATRQADPFQRAAASVKSKDLPAILPPTHTSRSVRAAILVGSPSRRNLAGRASSRHRRPFQRASAPPFACGGKKLPAVPESRPDVARADRARRRYQQVSQSWQRRHQPPVAIEPGSIRSEVTAVATEPVCAGRSPWLHRPPVQRSHAPVSWLNTHTFRADDAPTTGDGAAGPRSNAVSAVPGTATRSHARPDQCSITA